MHLTIYFPLVSEIFSSGIFGVWEYHHCIIIITMISKSLHVYFLSYAFQLLLVSLLSILSCILLVVPIEIRVTFDAF